MDLPSITDALPMQCPECGHNYVFFDGDHEPDALDERGAFWAVCDKCLWLTKSFTTPRALLESLK